MNSPIPDRPPAAAAAVASPNAVLPPDGSRDSGIPWHYGDPHAEQRALLAGNALVDLSNRCIVRVSGTDRLSWLNDLTTQKVDALTVGESRLALILDPHGHVEHELHLIDDGSLTWLIVEPGSAESLVKYLDAMRFLRDVVVEDVTTAFAVVWCPEGDIEINGPTWQEPAEFSGKGQSESGADRGGDATKYVIGRPAHLVGAEVIVPRGELPALLAGSPGLAGSWALEALRVAAAVPRMNAETDHKSLPHELGWIGPGVHLAKGCYRGQETVARLHNMGRPPRRLALLHLDGSVETLPAHGDEVLFGDRVVGFVGTSARHYELGPIATAVLKRTVPTDEELAVRTADGTLVAAGQEAVIIG